MAGSKDTTTKKLHAVTGINLLTCLENANELKVTDKEFLYLTPVQAGYVLVYYR